MEEYAFRLSIELPKLGFEVIVLCEKSFSSDSFPVVVIELGETIKPRWFSHYQFSRKVRKWLAKKTQIKLELFTVTNGRVVTMCLPFILPRLVMVAEDFPGS